MVGRVTFRGETELLAVLAQQQNILVDETLDQGALTALMPLEDATRANARTHREAGTPPGGHLDEGIVSRKTRNLSRYSREYWTTFANRARKIAHLLEFGTAPHAQPKRGNYHPGARPFPFFRPAFESTGESVITRFSVWAWRRISLTARR